MAQLSVHPGPAHLSLGKLGFISPSTLPLFIFIFRAQLVSQESGRSFCDLLVW